MSLSSFCVVMNALRLKLFKFKHPEEVEAAGETGVYHISADNTDISLNENIIKQKGETNMQKKIHVEGMSCGHCSARVEKALNALEGVEAKVDLEAKTAFVRAGEGITDEVLKKAVEDAGYEVTGIE